MLRGMVRMDHLILHGDIVPPEKFHHLSSRMDKVGDVVNDPVDGDFGSLEAFDGSHGLGGGIGVDIGGGDRAGCAGDALAEAGYVGVGWHDGGLRGRLRRKPEVTGVFWEERHEQWLLRVGKGGEPRCLLSLFSKTPGMTDEKIVAVASGRKRGPSGIEFVSIFPVLYNHVGRRQTQKDISRRNLTIIYLLSCLIYFHHT